MSDPGQLPLLSEAPFEEALLLSGDEVAKRYTAEHGKQIAWRRKACVELLGMSVPTTDIARILSMNPRTIAAIAAQEGQKIAVFSELHSQVLASSAMGDIALAQTKRDKASYKDLHIAAGIKLTHATALKMIGAAGSLGEGGHVENEVESEALVQARRVADQIWQEEQAKANPDAGAESPAPDQPK